MKVGESVKERIALHVESARFLLDEKLKKEKSKQREHILVGFDVGVFYALHAVYSALSNKKEKSNGKNKKTTKAKTCSRTARGNTGKRNRPIS
jgi:hypothetical protein